MSENSKRALNVFDVKNLEVKHPASKVWSTNVLGVKQLESVGRCVTSSDDMSNFTASEFAGPWLFKYQSFQMLVDLHIASAFSFHKHYLCS